MTTGSPTDPANGTGISTSAVPLPPVVQIEPTSRCNLRCLGCAHRYRTGNLADIPFERVKALLDELRGHTAEIIFSGIGEPLLNPHLVELLAYAKRSPGFHTTIASNFMLMHGKAVEELYPFVRQVTAPSMRPTRRPSRRCGRGPGSIRCARILNGSSTSTPATAGRSMSR